MLIKKRRKFLFLLSKIRYRLRDNQIYFLFSGHFRIGLVRIKQAGYRKKNSYQTHHKIGKKDKVSRPDPLNNASIRYSDI